MIICDVISSIYSFLLLGKNSIDISIPCIGQTCVVKSIMTTLLGQLQSINKKLVCIILCNEELTILQILSERDIMNECGHNKDDKMPFGNMLVIT